MSNIRYEYMTAYIESAKQVGRLENAIGWYHSHPHITVWPSHVGKYINSLLHREKVMSW